MHIKKLKIQNFKIFKSCTFPFNEDINILVGDNESGKSTILEAIEIGLNCSYRGKSLMSELAADLFNTNAVIEYLESDMSAQDLPEICIEVFLEGVPEYKGDNNSLGENAEGISLKVRFDDELLPAYEEFIEDVKGIKTIPSEFYRIEWFDFAWNRIRYMNRKVNGLLVDPTRLHPSYGKTQYISKIISATLSKQKQALLNLNYRQLKELFNEQPQVNEINKMLDTDNSITEKTLGIIADVSPANTARTGLQLAVNQISFPMIGKGEQNQIQIKLAIQNTAKNVHILMIEEPENHLSHVNLSKLISHIEEKRNNKQLFITTHSSYVLNKLSLRKLCLIAKNYTRLKDMDNKVAKRLKRLPGYDTLRAVLASNVVLVEGPSDELILKKIFLNQHGQLPEEKGIDIIVVRGIGFQNYIEIATQIGTKMNVVKDNDGDYVKNIKEYAEKYNSYTSIRFFSSKNNDIYSLEPAMIASNSADELLLDEYARVALSKMTFGKYNQNIDLDMKISFLRNWYKGDSGEGRKKVDSAMRIFESNKVLLYPEYLKKALDFD